jgi:hypothetical protein
MNLKQIYAKPLSLSSQNLDDFIKYFYCINHYRILHFARIDIPISNIECN